MNKKFCYWTVADKDHAKMAQIMVRSARNIGITEDFHIWTDKSSIDGAIVHNCGDFNKRSYMFKFAFLKDQVSVLDYDYFIFIDADNYFVANPGNLTELMIGNKIFCQMENEITSPNVVRKDWWGCPIYKYKALFSRMGLKLDKIYNTNAGFWIVDKNHIDQFYNIGVNFHLKCKEDGFDNFTEEVSLAFMGHCMQHPESRTMDKTSWLWASDWNGYWQNELPTYSEWEFEDYLTGEKRMIKPCIVHCMRSKYLMTSLYDNIYV